MVTERIYVVSGEGEVGTKEEYTGKLTQRAMRARLTREQCGGDRWAKFVDDEGYQVWPEMYVNDQAGDDFVPGL